MREKEGVRPTTPRPKPEPASPENPKQPRALDDPVKLDRAARIMQNALARQGLTIADLKAPAEDREPVPI